MWGSLLNQAMTRRLNTLLVFRWGHLQAVHGEAFQVGLESSEEVYSAHTPTFKGGDCAHLDILNYSVSYLLAFWAKTCWCEAVLPVASAAEVFRRGPWSVTVRWHLYLAWLKEDPWSGSSSGLTSIGLTGIQEPLSNMVEIRRRFKNCSGWEGVWKADELAKWFGGSWYLRKVK